MPRPDSTSLAFLVQGGGPVLPLQGVTLLVVEDSKFASDALRLMAQRSGARMRRAGNLADARRHLQLYRPDVVLVDMGLPDGSGASLIAEIVALQTNSPVVLGLSGDPDTRPAAMAVGAAGFVEKPLPGLAAFQALIARHVPRLTGVHPVAEDTDIAADPLTLREDLDTAARLLAEGPDMPQRRYLARFLGGLARSSGDPALERAARGLIGGDCAALEVLAGLIAQRIGDQPRAFSLGQHPF